MKKIFKTMAITGAMLTVGMAGTSDYYLMELGQDHPSYVWVGLAIGIVLMLPYLFTKEGKYDVYR
jgi:hypothetical protein